MLPADSPPPDAVRSDSVRSDSVRSDSVRSDSVRSDATGRSPALPVAVAVAVGIAADAAFHLPRLLALGAAAFLVVLLPLTAGRLARGYRVALLLTLFGLLGVAGHHAAWHDRGPQSLTRLLKADSQLVRLTGIIASSPQIDRRRETGRTAAWLVEDRSRCVLNVTAVSTDAGTLPLSGRVQLAVTGHLLHVGVGDQIEAVGWLARPEPPPNPGGFDWAMSLRRQQIDAGFYCGHPDAVHLLNQPPTGLPQSIGAVREALAYRFAEHLSGANAPVGAAMILGERAGLSDATRDAYIASGAMHILAISGLHVGLLALLLVWLGRVVGAPQTAVAVGVVLVALAYALLTGLRPPVLRATVFLAVYAVAVVVARRGSLLNTAAVTSLGFLLCDPPLLFDPGAQLSFLAIFGMCWAMRLRITPRPMPGAALRWRMLHRLTTMQTLALGIWVFTTPALAAYFQIISPVGFLLNVVLIPLATAVLWTGYGFLGVALLAPRLAGPLGAAFDLGLSAVNALVEAAAAWNLGHIATPGPPVWWLVGCYGWLAVTLVWPRLLGRPLRAVCVLLVWMAAGLGIACLPPAPTDHLQVTVLSVGHGGATLLLFPNGTTALYDCGSMDDDRHAAETVWRAVRAAGRTRIDVAFLSHADLDHCNNAAALLQRGPVGAIGVGRSFLDLDQNVVAQVLSAAAAQHVPVRLLAAGDRLAFDPAVAVTVLHPPDRGPARQGTAEDDNANSLVLQLKIAGRTVLLTGDLEGSGQADLMAAVPAGRVDVLLAPHHGGLKANTPSFAAWAAPRIVAVSAGRAVNTAAVTAIYADATRICLTPRDGAVTVQLHTDGRLNVETARDK